jgi:hypothetical protein
LRCGADAPSEETSAGERDDQSGKGADPSWAELHEAFYTTFLWWLLRRSIIASHIPAPIADRDPYRNYEG